MALILLALWLLTRSHIGVAAEALPELAGGAEAGGAAGGGMGMDFNDMPFGKTLGSIGGKLVHAVTGAIGTHGPEERANIGPMGSLD